MGNKLTRTHYLVLLAAFLGWMFDGMVMGLIPIVGGPAVQDLLNTSDNGIIGYWMGRYAALFLTGAALGGIVFGWMGDKVGRVKSMAISIIIYSLYFSSLSEQLAWEDNGPWLFPSLWKYGLKKTGLFWPVSSGLQIIWAW